jgi:hypothetical protein
MDISGQLQGRPARRKSTPLDTEREAGWTPE